MGFLEKLFGSSDQPYPTLPTANPSPSSGDVLNQPPEEDGFFNTIFGAKQLAYPVVPRNVPTLPAPGVPALPSVPSAPTVPLPTAPPVTLAPPVSVTAPTGSVAPSSAPAPVIRETAPTLGASAPAPVSPVTVVFSGWPTPPPPSSTAAPSSAPVSAPAPIVSAPVASSDPAPVAPGVAAPATPTVLSGVPCAAPPVVFLMNESPVDQFVTAISHSPRFRPLESRAHESLLEEMLDENLTIKMITRESAPLAFEVPEGADSVEFSYGPIEAAATSGCDDALDQVVTIGDARVQHERGNIEGPIVGVLSAGAVLSVTIPWRAASFVSLGAGQLQVKVHARFFTACTGVDTDGST